MQYFKSNQKKRYELATPESRKLNQKARTFMPGGNSRTILHYDPYPAFIVKGQGCRVFDADGNERIDFLNNQSSTILGHAHPAVLSAVTDQLPRGTALGGPTETQIELADMLCSRLPSVEKIRFTNSGTEATLNAIRAARAFTGKEKIGKFEGAFHGVHDGVSVSIGPPIEEAGDPKRPVGYLQSQLAPSGAGISQRVLEEVLILPFNDFSSTQRLLEENSEDLAAVIIDPIMSASGYPPIRDNFLSKLRDLTEELGILLIFDEVISVRVDRGGVQGLFNVNPDLTTVGKTIGGGFPVGAFGGREDIMHLFDPTDGPPQVAHSGTFNANPITMVAGVATLQQLNQETYIRLSSLGSILRDKLQTLFAEMDFPAQVMGIASLFKIHFTQDDILNYRSVAGANKDLAQQVFWGLLNEGIQLGPLCDGNLSTPMGDGEIDEFVSAMGRVIQS